MYRCEICNAVSEPNQPQHKHTLYRSVKDKVTGLTRVEVAKEYAVCRECKEDLEAGVSLRIMLEEHQPSLKHHIVPVKPSAHIAEGGANTVPSVEPMKTDKPSNGVTFKLNPIRKKPKEN